MSNEELQEIYALWESDSPRRPFVHVLMDYVESSTHNPPVLIETDVSGRLSKVFLLE